MIPVLNHESSGNSMNSRSEWHRVRDRIKHTTLPDSRMNNMGRPEPAAESMGLSPKHCELLALSMSRMCEDMIVGVQSNLGHVDLMQPAEYGSS